MSGGKISYLRFKPIAAAIEVKEAEREERWLREKLRVLPPAWGRHAKAEHRRMGGLKSQAANLWLLGLVEPAGGRLPLSASDREIRAAAVEAARDAQVIARADFDMGAGNAEIRRSLVVHCMSWGIEPAHHDGVPGMLRMLDERWYVRRIRSAHGRRAESIAIGAGVVRRGLWIYATQDAVERRQAQRRANAAAISKATVECEATGESLALADVVAASVANPEVKRAELMVRIKGCDAIAAEEGACCEFWTLTAPSEYHAQRIRFGKPEKNPNYKDHSPRDAQRYLTRVWARARAAWKRRGLSVFGLRTAEPHHDGCPHWHLIAYGSRRELRFARRLLRVYAMRQSRDEEGAKEHRFKVLEAKAGSKGAAYAAKYVSKNVDGKGLEGDIDQEGQKKISASVKRVDAWAATWGIRQFQFFGCPAISGWRVLRRMRGPVAVVGSMLERARSAADDSDFAGYWRAALAGGLALVYAAKEVLTEYGDAAAARIAGIREGGRLAMLPEKEWSIKWRGGSVKRGFGFPRSCVNNCTGEENIAAAIFA